MIPYKIAKKHVFATGEIKQFNGKVAKVEFAYYKGILFIINETSYVPYYENETLKQAIENIKSGLQYPKVNNFQMKKGERK